MTRRKDFRVIFKNISYYNTRCGWIKKLLYNKSEVASPWMKSKDSAENWMYDNRDTLFHCELLSYEQHTESRTRRHSEDNK